MVLIMHNPREIEKRLENAKSRIPEKPEINKTLILKFVDECYSRGLGQNRILSIVNRLSLVARWLDKNFNAVTKDDLKSLMAKIERGETYSLRLRNHPTEKKAYSEWTISTYKKMIKKFWQWLKGYEYNNSKDFPDEVKWIRTGARTSKLSDPIVLTKDEVKRMFEAAEGIREKALVSFMYESGCRSPDELLTLKISDVEFVENMAKVKLCSGKVGGRTIPIVACIPYLKAWIENEHPNTEPDSYLWVNKSIRNHSKMMGDASLRLMVKRWAKNAGIHKRVTPYTFRRTRYTHLSNKIPTPALYKIMVQIQGA